MGCYIWYSGEGTEGGGAQPAQAPSRCTKCNSAPINANVAITVLLYNGPLLCNFCRAMLCISAATAGTRCPSVCLSVCLSVRPSVTFVSCAKTNKDIFEIFSPSGSQAILVFFYAKRDGDIPTGTPLTGLSNASGVGNKRNSERISLHTLHTVLQCCKPYESRSVKNKAATDGVEPSTHGGVGRRCSHKTTMKCL